MAAALYHQLQQSVIRSCDTRCAEIADAIGEHPQYAPLLPSVSQEYVFLHVLHTKDSGDSYIAD